MMKARSKRLPAVLLLFGIIYMLHFTGKRPRLPSLERRLTSKFSSQDEMPIEKHIWQSWKTREKLGKEFKENTQLWAASTDYNYHFLDDDQALDFVEKYYAEFPEVIHAYRILPRKVLRADFFRYLVVLAQGGIYADIDTRLNVPVDAWLKDAQIARIAREYGISMANISAIIGVEDECDCWGWRAIFTRRLQFCQWTFAAKRGHPIFVDLVSKITHLTLNNYDASSGLLTFPKGYKGMGNTATVYNMTEGSNSWYEGILEWTGPGPFTDSIFHYLNTYYATYFKDLLEGSDNVVSCSSDKQCFIDPNKPLDIISNLQYPPPHGDKLLGRKLPRQPLGWENFTMIEEPILVGSVVILPKKYFNQKHATDPTENYVEHGFKGTWKWSQS